MKKKLAMLLAVTMLATLFTGCGAGGKEDKGELNLYTWDGMFPQEILDGFEKETGIRINYSNFDYDEDMLAKLEETKGGDYDLVIVMTISLSWPFRRAWLRSWILPGSVLMIT